MKVLLINGSPRAKGNTFIALSEVANTLQEAGVETQIVHIGTQAVRGCVVCGACRKNNTHCAFSDALYDELRQILDEGIDGLVVGSPVYYAGPNGSLCALLDRLFYSCRSKMAYKPAASVAVCRRGGATAAFESLNMPFQMMNMPIVTSQYWNIVYGRTEGEAALDTEGLQTMRTLARNMAWLLKTTNGTPAPGRPSNEPWDAMHFIR